MAETEEKDVEMKSEATDSPGEGKPEPTAWTGGADETERWTDMSIMFTRPSEKYAPPNFDPSEEDYLEWLQEDRRVLVVGAGGLGCEILKNLALSGVRDIEVIDLDIIDLSNLNRQFLFRMKDIGMPKAKCAAEFVMKRVPGCTVKWYQRPLQEFDEGFYKKFDCVIAGLDNVEARRWLNAMLWDLVQTDEEGNLIPDTIIPFIDGGTEGFLGQARLFVPRLTACFECSVGTMTPQKGFQMCTIASIPRRPEHCVAYAQKKLWPRLKSLRTAADYDMEPLKSKVPDPAGVKFDSDDVDHMSWIFHRAVERAKEFDIEGVTFSLTMQVVKNIIPAIASTNALVSAACVNECIKALTWCSYGLNNYFMYMGQDGVYARTFEYKPNPGCPICGTEPLQYSIDPGTTLEMLYAKIMADDVLKLKGPAISADGKTIFMTSKALRPMYEANMSKPISELFDDEAVLVLTDPVLGRGAARVRVKFEEGAIYVPPTEE